MLYFLKTVPFFICRRDCVSMSTNSKVSKLEKLESMDCNLFM